LEERNFQRHGSLFFFFSPSLPSSLASRVKI
jgi:hypothetical protein